MTGYYSYEQTLHALYNLSPASHWSPPEPQAHSIPMDRETHDLLCDLNDMWLVHALTNPMLGTQEDRVVLVLNGIDSHGIAWIVTNIEGWWTTSEPEIPDLVKGWGDGSYFDTGRYQARTFTIEGYYYPLTPKPGAAAAARDRLIRACSLVRRQGFFVTRDWDMEKFTAVELAAPPLIDTMDQAGKTQFSITLKAPDPRKVSNVVRTRRFFGSGQGDSDAMVPDPNAYKYMDVTFGWPTYASLDRPGHGGEFDTYQELLYNDSTISGPDAGAGTGPGGTHVVTPPSASFGSYGYIENLGNYRADLVIEITDLDQEFTYDNPLVITNYTTGDQAKIVHNPEGKKLELDTLRRTVRLDDAPGYRMMLSPDSDWISVMEGENLISVEPNIRRDHKGEKLPQITFSFRHTWIG